MTTTGWKNGFAGVLAAFMVTAPGVSEAARHPLARAKSHPVAMVKSPARGAASRLALAGRVARADKPAHFSFAMRTKSGAVRHLAFLPTEPAQASFGQLYGLHSTTDSLDLKSSVALVLDSDTNEVLFSKNPQAVLPIASLTKLMTALVVTEAHLPLNEVLTITDEDVDTEKNSRSRLRVGTALTREELLHLALMASENRAAHALGRTYPGGVEAFVAAMNAKANAIGMRDTQYVEPTGLSSRNQSSARDLATLVKAAQEHAIIREFSTSPELQVEVGNRTTSFRTTDALVRSPAWDILLQKTGFINEAGRCLVMQARMSGRKLIMVFLDSAGRHSHLGDAERVRRWVTELPARPAVVPATSVAPKA